MDFWMWEVEQELAPSTPHINPVCNTSRNGAKKKKKHMKGQMGCLPGITSSLAVEILYLKH